MTAPEANAVPPEGAAAPARRLSLGVIFLTLLIDLIGFSIIFPLGPDLITYYLRVDAGSGILGWILAQSEGAAHALGRDHAFAAVLFGGVITSFYAILQFVFAPFWGALSDRRGRRGVLRLTIAGTAVGYLVWVVSGSFWLFLLSRVVSGGFSGNLSVATAAVADVTTRKERSRAMGLVGAAFGLGLVTGPVLGAVSAQLNLLVRHPSLERIGINPYSVPALVSLALCVVNLIWVNRSFRETLPEEARAAAREARLRNPVRAILTLENPDVRRANIVAFVYSLAFVAMETSITFLAFRRFGYSAAQNGILLGFLGVCSIVTQGVIVRMILKKADEVRVLKAGLISTGAGLLVVGLGFHVWMMYFGLGLVALGAGLVNPSTTGLISLYSRQEEQGRMLGIFRSLGSLSRAVSPVVAGAVFSIFGSESVFVGSAALSAAALVLSSRLTNPVR
ncbi:MAG TPA: MFS transporter [Opitutaceae bacterium]|nr:MFS transporter [Opitutaceae bacterium]